MSIRGAGYKLFAALLLVGLLLLANGSGYASSADFIRTDGRRLVDGHHQTFAVKGVNLGNWLFPEAYLFRLKGRGALAPADLTNTIERLVGPEEAARFWAQFRDVYITQEDIAFIKAAGFNTVRVPLSWRLFVEEGDGGAVRFEGPGWSLLDRLVQWCRDSGLRVLIDLHSAPGGQTGHTHDEGTGYPLLFYVPEYKRLTIALWQKLAEHYRDETALLGYDLLNEPISPFSNPDYLNPRLEPLYSDIVTAIRSVDPNHVVVLGGTQWETSFAAFGRPFDRNAAYTYHKFWFEPNRAAVQEYVNFSNRWKVPVILGETGEYNDDFNVKIRKLQEQFGMGWIFWTYKNLGSTLSVVTIRKPPGWDLIAKAVTADDASLPSREEARSILDAYLDAAKFKNVQINAGYLHSLGMVVP
ncbi:MAG TPA: cellulase family glycosylhydrolase [Bradyrhizobium sp.]|nr:cellulase family glycosylhydrolase [Bradyrhizobium sp.]